MEIIDLSESLATTPATSNYVVDLDRKDRFYLNPLVKASLRNKKEEFGFGLLGAAVYYRTYSRIMENGAQERWADTVIRVVEGAMTIRKWWYLRNGIRWDEFYWQQKAGEMTNAIFEMRMLAPGRGLVA